MRLENTILQTLPGTRFSVAAVNPVMALSRRHVLAAWCAIYRRCAFCAIRGAEVHGMASLDANHMTSVNTKQMSSLEVKYMMTRAPHPSSWNSHLRASEVLGADVRLQMKFMEVHAHVVPEGPV